MTTTTILNKPEDKLYGVVEGFYGKPWTIVQRKELFKRMKEFDLNVYMYAPKDDLKHRAYWRELYLPEEAEQLKNLIKVSKENDVTFYYAISPGLDMVYSSEKEVNFLKKKLEQVKQFGCDAFAILYDDIEPELSKTDKEVFQSFAQAQVSVTNQVYQALGQPKFIFCPTEYCASRAIPNVRTSEYLNTIGNNLINEIMIMWTGAKVISKTLTVQQLKELFEVLKRKPVIWDNLTANDFDNRRVFLGPYDGRSTEIKEHIAGVFSNPNCEYEANFITLHTISQWAKCNNDHHIKSIELKSSNNDLIDGNDCDFKSSFDDLNSTAYHPKRALKLAIEAWLPEFHRQKNIFPKPSDIISTPIPTVAVNNLINTGNNNIPLITSTADEQIIKDRNEQMIEEIENAIKDGTPISDLNATDSTFQPITKELTNSLLDPPIVLNPLEPMDCVMSVDVHLTTNSTNNNGHELNKITDETMEDVLENDHHQIKENEITGIKDVDSQSSEEIMQTELTNSTNNNEITYEDINFLVGLFYLPFEHGSNGLQLLNEFNWLIYNAYLITNYRAKKGANTEKSSDVLEWFERSIKFEKTADFVTSLLSKLVNCKNRCLIYELYPYLWDISTIISLLNTYVKWLSLGHVESSTPILQSPFNWFSYRDAFESGMQEPWLFRNGLSGDLQRLLPLENVNDLFTFKAPDSPSSHTFNIRPYSPSDEQLIYNVYRKTNSSNQSENEDYSFEDAPDLIAKKFVGSFLSLNSDFCFVVEDLIEKKICGYILAGPDTYLKYPTLLAKKISKGEKLDGIEGTISDLQEIQEMKFIIPELIFSNYSSICRIDLLDYVLENDLSVPKRLLICLSAALKTASGTKGLFTVINDTSNKKAIDFYLKLGFQEIFCPNDVKFIEGDIFLGRNI